jgi:hypothetical protein
LIEKTNNTEGKTAATNMKDKRKRRKDRSSTMNQNRGEEVKLKIEKKNRRKI